MGLVELSNMLWRELVELPEEQELVFAAGPRALDRPGLHQPAGPIFARPVAANASVQVNVAGPGVEDIDAPATIAKLQLVQPSLVDFLQ